MTKEERSEEKSWQPETPRGATHCIVCYCSWADWSLTQFPLGERRISGPAKGIHISGFSVQSPRMGAPAIWWASNETVLLRGEARQRRSPLRHRAAPLKPDKQTRSFPLPSGVMGIEGRTFKAFVLKRPNNLTPSDSCVLHIYDTRAP